MADIASLDRHLASLQASPTTIDLLRDLHTQALTEPPYVSTDNQPASVALDRFVALEPDKCALVYLLLRAAGARYVLEAGTSFGVSTIWLALAVGQNAGLQNSDGIVIATERTSQPRLAEPESTGSGPGEMLRSGFIDFLLLDIWSALALPTLKVIKTRLKPGALIVADNVVSSKDGYADLIAYLDDPRNRFKTTTAPYSGGLLVAVYTGN
ncbi:o-methyltransferase [Colletotrichum chrysophilum]|uniref:O-methyltransferase n=1 Tax=Colletotrichum chrysophilum TaxID=1836956 RepID=A0AAD9A4U7_9PEZI|nr:o-methyltransferase [Colletotrichum chrysophilum]